MPEYFASIPSISEAALDTIASALQTKGLIVLPEGLPTVLADALYRRVVAIADSAKRAGVGRGTHYIQAANVRTDSIAWLGTEHPAERAYLAWMEAIRLGINRRLFLGLFDYEAHFAVYEPGAYYRKHLDAFKGTTNRVLTTVLYLNPEWEHDDGGELLVYEPEQDTVLESIAPEFAKLGVFLSEQFPHEVLAPRRRRYSIAGWFRVSASSR
jgi:SM-20-related protein